MTRNRKIGLLLVGIGLLMVSLSLVVQAVGISLFATLLAYSAAMVTSLACKCLGKVVRDKS